MKVATGRFTVTAGTGNQVISGVGFQPSAYILIYTKNDTDDVDSVGTGSILSIGMTDGTTEFCMASGVEDAQGTSDVGRRGFSDRVLATHDAQANETVEGEASHVSMDVDGFTINKVVAFTGPATPIVHYIAFGGDAISTHVATVDLNDTQGLSVDETGPGFEPDVVITSYIGVFLDAGGDANNDAHSFSLGWALNPARQAGNNQYSMMTASRDAQGTTQSASRFDTTHAGTSYRDDAIDAAYEIGSFDASGFSVTTRLTGATTNEIMGYLALKLGTDPEVYTVGRTARTSTGDDVESSAGFQPVFLLGVGSAVVTAANANTNGGSMAIGITDGTNTFAIMQHDEDAVLTSNTSNRVTNTQFMSANTHAGLIDWEATFSSFDSGGWTINYGDAATSAFQNAFLAIGQSTRPVDLADHAAGQESDAFTESGGETGAELFAFKLTNNTAGAATVDEVVFQLSSVTGIVQGDFANLEIYVDSNNDGTISGGETTTVGGAGAVNVGVTTITFSTDYSVSAGATVNYILISDVNNLASGDSVTIALGKSNITLTADTTGGVDATSVIHTEVLFNDISSGSGLNSTTLHSMAFADFNNDGYLDMAKGTQSTSGNRTICINDKDKTFTCDSTVLSTGYRGLGWGDFDNDGDIDITATDGGPGPHVLQNDGAADGLSWTLVNPTANNHEAAMFADVDGDGDLDIWNPGETYLWYRNDGGTTFTGQNAMPGLGADDTPNGEGGTVVDLDADGYVDFFFADSATSTQVWTNDGDGTYTNHENVNTDFGLPENVGDHENMEWAWGDYDNDGDNDVFISGTNSVGLYRNDGTGSFTDVSGSSGVTIAATTDGADWGDYNQDGYLDLIVAKGASSILYRNDGDGTFTDVTPQIGIPSLGNVVGWIDIDNDGDLDLMDGEGGLFQNNTDTTNYLQVVVTGAGGSGNAPVTPIGAQITVYDAGTSDIVGFREVHASYNNFQPPPIQYFGLTPTDTYDIEVLFPSSDITCTVDDVQPDQVTFTVGATILNNTIEIREGLAVADHPAGQQSDAFSDSGIETDAELFAFELDPGGSTKTVSQLVFSISSIVGLVDGDWANVEIRVDDNDDGNITGGETTTVGGAGSVSTAGGTITFSTSFNVTSVTSYILRADFASLSNDDTVTLDWSLGTLSACGAPFGTTSSATHLEFLVNKVFYAKLNDGSGTTATDSSGNGNDGTVTNAAWVDGIHGGALDFDGTGDFVDIPTSIAGSDVGSISLWVRTNTNFTDIAHLYYGSTVTGGDGLGGQKELHVNFTSSETIQFFIEGAPDVSITSSTAYADGAWHHVAATWDISGNAILYVDGTSAGSATHDADNFVFSSTHRLARPGANSNLFTGRLDDVRVYDEVLSVTEIQTLARGSGLLAHWKLDDGSGTTATDSVGTDDGTLINMEAGDWIAGRLCSALDFDGVDEYVQTTSDAMLDPSSLTISAWFQTDTTTGPHHIVWQGVGTQNGWGGGSENPSQNEMHITVGRFDTNDVLLFYYGSANSGSWVEIQTAFTDTTGWHHVAVTLSGADGPTATGELFLDGVSQGTDTGTQTDRSQWDTNVRIGRPGTATRYFQGSIDDVRIYNRVLTTVEIQALSATYTIIDLGTLTTDRSLGISINNSEQVAGFDQDSTTNNESAWRSQYCLMTGLGTLTGGTVSAALGINDAGTVCGWSDTTGGVRKAFTWTSGGGMVDLGVLSGKTDSEGTGINANGEVAGSSLNFGTEPADWLAFLYLPIAAYSLSAGMNSLGTLGGTVSVAMDLNDSGEVVGGAETAAGFLEPFIWLPSAAYSFSAGINSLGTLGDDERTLLHRAQALNSNGETVGRSYTAAGEGHAFIWLPSAAYTLSAGMTDLGVLTGGDDSWAFDINESGEVVGTSSVTGGALHAFLWANGTMTDLNDLIDTNSAWTLIRAGGINDDGEIVGWATDGGGNVRAFVLVQTCSTTATAVQTAGRLLALGSGETSVDGIFEQTVFDETNSPLAEILIDAAMEGADFTFRVTADSLFPPSLSTARPVPPVGLAEGGVVDRTLEIDATLPPGSITATVGMVVGHDELDDLNLLPEELELHVFDEASSRWVPAGVNIGESAPTDIVGESGYVPNADDTITYWAVRDTLSLFAVGATAQGIDEQPDLEQPIPDLDIALPSMCGVGVIQAGLFSLACLMLTLAGRRGVASRRRVAPRESRSCPVE